MKTVKFFDKVNGKKTTLHSTYEINNDSELANAMFQVIGFPNLNPDIDFEKVYNGNEQVESEDFVMEFELNVVAIDALLEERAILHDTLEESPEHSSAWKEAGSRLGDVLEELEKLGWNNGK